MTPRQRLLLIIPGVLFLVAFGAFELGHYGGLRTAARKAAAEKSAEQEEDLAQSDAKLMKTLLAQNLAERTFPFPGVIEGSTGKTLRPFDPAAAPAAAILAAVREAADHALATHNSPDSPIRSLRRINEASRFFEDTLREKLDAHPDLFCTVPTNEKGAEQRTGYPDLRIEHVASGTVAYLDPKLFEATSHDSSLRSFYYTPRAESSKVREDAYHLLLGFSHDGNDGAWSFSAWELIDLARLQVRLKAEFQASNRDLYRDKARLAGSTE